MFSHAPGTSSTQSEPAAVPLDPSRQKVAQRAAERRPPQTNEGLRRSRVTHARSIYADYNHAPHHRGDRITIQLTSKYSRSRICQTASVSSTVRAPGPRLHLLKPRRLVQSVFIPVGCGVTGQGARQLSRRCVLLERVAEDLQKSMAMPTSTTDEMFGLPATAKASRRPRQRLS